MTDITCFLHGLSNERLPPSAGWEWRDFGESILQPLLRLLSSGTSIEKRNAVHLIRQMWFQDKFRDWILESTVEPSVRNLQDPDPLTRGYTAAVLSDIRDPRAFEPMLALTRDPDAYVRWVVAWALGQFNDARAIPHLEWISENDSAWQMVHGQDEAYKQMNRDVAIRTIAKLRALEGQ